MPLNVVLVLGAAATGLMWWRDWKVDGAGGGSFGYGSTMIRTGSPFLFVLTTLTFLTACGVGSALAEETANSTTEVRRIQTSNQSGHAFRLTYTVDVPLAHFWKFKTDFGADFLLTNRYIVSHRLVSRHNNVYITETRYADAPGTEFRWQTTVYPSAHRMNYLLLNPEECGQRYNRGTIQLTSETGKTRIEHSTYFDFFGATIWAHFPGPGGMEGFLRYTADWERKTIKELQHRYAR